MNRPTGVTIDKKGVLYVDNTGDSAVVEFALGSLKPLKRQINKSLFGTSASHIIPHCYLESPRASAPQHDVRESGPCLLSGLCSIAGIAAWIGIAAAPA